MNNSYKKKVAKTKMENRPTKISMGFLDQSTDRKAVRRLKKAVRMRSFKDKWIDLTIASQILTPLGYNNKCINY